MSLTYANLKTALQDYTENDETSFEKSVLGKKLSMTACGNGRAFPKDVTFIEDNAASILIISCDFF